MQCAACTWSSCFSCTGAAEGTASACLPLCRERRGGRDHIWLVTHDEGSCWVPAAIRPSIILSHWGRTDLNHSSLSGYHYMDSYRCGVGRPLVDTRKPTVWLRCCFVSCIILTLPAVLRLSLTAAWTTIMRR